MPGEKNHNMEQAKAVETSSIHSSRAPRGDQETVTENIKQSQIEAAEGLTPSKTNQSEAEPEYPSRKKLIPTVIALYLAFFLVALVCYISLRDKAKSNQKIGPHNHCDRHPYNH